MGSNFAAFILNPAGNTTFEYRLISISQTQYSSCILASDVVNFQLQEQVLKLTNQIFDSFDGAVVFAGVNTITKAAINIAKTFFPHSGGEKWKILNKKAESFEIVADPNDIPYWFFHGGTGSTGAQRDPTDPREYWCWRRCLGNEHRITLQEYFNPDPQNWLIGSSSEECAILTPALARPNKAITRSRIFRTGENMIDSSESGKLKGPSPQAATRQSLKGKLEPIKEVEDE